MILNNKAFSAALLLGLTLGLSSLATVRAAAGHDSGHGTGHGHGGGHGHGSGHGYAADARIGQPGKAAQVSRTVEVNLRDSYFEPASLQVAAGETISFVVTNTGELVHEFNIGTASMHRAHQKEMQTMMAQGHMTATDVSMGSGGMSHDDPNSVLLEPGESAEVVWRFPQSGELEFACNVPGHYESGMRGDIEIGR